MIILFKQKCNIDLLFIIINIKLIKKIKFLKIILNKLFLKRENKYKIIFSVEIYSLIIKAKIF